MAFRRRTSLAHRLFAIAVASFFLPSAWPHDIPNERIDRSIQVSLSPGSIAIDYEVSLTELTLTQDLRRLIGSLPGADRQEWLDRYGQVTGPLNAKGILASVDGEAVSLAMSRFDLVVEDHPRYTFRLVGQVPPAGRLRLRDTNYVSSEGTSRLAVRGQGGVVVTGDPLPTDVTQIEIRPVWILSDAEERRTKQVDVDYRTPGQTGLNVVSPLPPASTAHSTGVPAENPAPKTSRAGTAGPGRLMRLLDETSSVSWVVLFLIALALGAAHSIGPGHGKTLVTAVALGPGVRFYQPAILGLAATLAHTGSVLLIAAALWYTGATRVGTVHEALAKLAGFVIGAAGLWRIGRLLAGYADHGDDELAHGDINNRGLIGLGLAGGLVPCWDAVALLLLATALGRLAAGVVLVLAFSAGMALVLVAVGLLAWKLKSAAFRAESQNRWRRPLGLACGGILSVIGCYLFFQ